MVNEFEIVCGHCGGTGYIGEGFTVECATDMSACKIVCGHCHSELTFDPFAFLNIDDILWHSCDDDWTMND